MIQKTEIVSILKKRSLGLAFVVGAAAFTFAQEKINVTGKVVDNANTPVPYASVTFSSANKSGDAALADENGNFTVSVAPGAYTVEVEAIDFQKATKTLTVSKAGSIGNLVLSKEASATLNNTTEITGVTITKSTKPYRVEIDKKVYDPAADIVSKGGNLQDVLSNVPSVAVDTDGTVSMRGNSNIKFLINGKPSTMLGIDDGANALQSIPADQIERIEVITNPSSKYEAAGTAGILNIILKKTAKLGFNGSVEGTIGYLPNTRLNTNLSWKKGAWTYYINGGGGYNRGRSKNNSENYSFLSPTEVTDGFSLHSIQNSTSKNENKSYNATAGLAVDITDKSALTASVMVRSFNNASNGVTDYFDHVVIKDRTIAGYPNVPFTVTDIYTNRLNDGTNKNISFQGDLGFDQKIGDNGQLLSLAASFGKNNSDGMSTISENGYDYALNTPSLRFNNIDTHSKNTTALAKADYELPIGENSKLEAGARFDLNKNEYDYYVDENKNGGFTYILPEFTSNTTYDEKVLAGYAQFKSKFDKLGYQLGLRAENTVVDVDFKKINDANLTSVHKNYTGLFPSVFLSYDLGKNNQLLLNYSRRIQRPRSFFLIPFMSYNNNRNLFTGNPDLDPTYENSFEFGYSLQKSKITLNPTLYYKKSVDEVNTYSTLGIDNDGNTVVQTIPVNAGTDEDYGLDLNFTYDPFKWWRLMGNIDLYGYRRKGSYLDFDFSGKGFSERLRLTSTFKPDKLTSLQIQGFYRGGEKTASVNRKSMYAVNFGATRTIWDGNGTVAFNIQDIFNTRTRRQTTTTATYTQENYMQWQPRQFTISLTYRFKQGEKVEVPRKKRDNDANYQDDDQGPM